MLPLLFASLFVLNTCSDSCGNLRIPFPFYLNASCGEISTDFQLTCLNSSIHLQIGTKSYRVTEFFSDGILVDFPGPNSCRKYNDLNSFEFRNSCPFGIAMENVVGLYDCEDLSVCRTSCEKMKLRECDGESPSCCYMLKDGGVWKKGEELGVFMEYGCRGVSSWVVERGWNWGKRGVKLEWGIPRNLSEGICGENAYVSNATAVEDAVRCSCTEGYLGDGFVNGYGCLKSCIKDGMNAYGSDCHIKRHSEKKLVIFTGVLAPLFIVASLIILFCILKRPIKQTALDSSHGQFPSNMMLQKSCRTRLFTYDELEEATGGFRDEEKLVKSRNGVIFPGFLGDGSRVAIHRLEYGNEGDLINVLSHIEILNALAHKNVAHILGCCFDSGCAPMVIYEHPSNGALEKHLHYQKGNELSLDWSRRLKIAAETANVLTFLQFEVSPPILHRCLESGHIFLDTEFSAKVLGFSLLKAVGESKSHLLEEASCFQKNGSDVYGFGVVLLEMVTGLKNSDLPMVALQKIRSGKLEEVVDPVLNYHEETPQRREQMEIVADLATRCLLFGRDGKLKMNDVSKELMNIVKQGFDGSGLKGPAIEETFSNSSLLQMISMSPDSILAP